MNDLPALCRELCDEVQTAVRLFEERLPDDPQAERVKAIADVIWSTAELLQDPTFDSQTQTKEKQCDRPQRSL